MMITMDVAELVAIAAVVAAVFFAIGIFMPRKQNEAKTIADLIEQLTEMMLVPASVKDLGENLEAAMLPDILQRIGECIDEAIRINLPTEEKFRETVEAMVTVAHAAAPAPKIATVTAPNRKRKKLHHA